MENVMINIIIDVIILIISFTAGFYIAKKKYYSQDSLFMQEAKAKAQVIELEAKNTLNIAKEEAKKHIDKEFAKARSDMQKKKIDVDNYVKNELDSLKLDKQLILNSKKEIESLKKGLALKEQEYKQKTKNCIKVLENASGLTQDEAFEKMIEIVKKESRDKVASIFRKEYKIAKDKTKEEVNKILSNAVTRYAGEFAAERLVNHIDLADNDTKGKIIGKEGRNIKSLEMTLGVDIIIEEESTITISSFNLYRRAIATKTIELLIEDGRIHPARIEEVYTSVKNEFDENIKKEGEEAVLALGISDMNEELIILVGKLRYRASYGQNALAHTIEVAYLSGLIASQIGGDTIKARRAGLLHDIGKSLTYDKKGSHVDLGAELCKRLNEPEEVINAIYAHHGQEDATSIESAAVCAADALSAARPGARRDVLQSFLKRVEDIETIAISKNGVQNAYAINAGRELRVIVNATLVNDDEAVLLSSEIAEEIEEQVQYPGEIKINVIRESRSTTYAR